MCCIQDDSPDGSDDSNVSAPHFASKYRQKFSLYTYPPISQLLYHLGPMAFTPIGNRDVLTLTDANSTRWRALTTPAVKQKLIIKISWQISRRILIISLICCYNIPTACTFNIVAGLKRNMALLPFFLTNFRAMKIPVTFCDNVTSLQRVVYFSPEI